MQHLYRKQNSHKYKRGDGRMKRDRKGGEGAGGGRGGGGETTCNIYR